MSFITVEPQSRVALESHSNGLLAQLDAHLGIIADRYLDFFRERSINLVSSLKLNTNCSIFRQSIEAT